MEKQEISETDAEFRSSPDGRSHGLIMINTTRP
jgi:hypothetical protein